MRISTRRALQIATATALVAGAIAFQRSYTFGLNLTPSLPGTLFLIHKGEPVQRGDLVAFRWPGGGPYAAGTTFVKALVGIPGDNVERFGRAVFVNETPFGVLKDKTRTGAPLAPGPTGTLPPDRFHVYAPHPDSLDSRYALTGWISRTQIIGKAHALF